MQRMHEKVSARQLDQQETIHIIYIHDSYHPAMGILLYYNYMSAEMYT